MHEISRASTSRSNDADRHRKQFQAKECRSTATNESATTEPIHLYIFLSTSDLRPQLRPHIPTRRAVTIYTKRIIFYTWIAEHKQCKQPQRDHNVTGPAYYFYTDRQTDHGRSNGGINSLEREERDESSAVFLRFADRSCIPMVYAIIYYPQRSRTVGEKCMEAVQNIR